MAFPFPPELLINILSRLPVKIIVRLRCVCKSWRSMIMSADFIAAHLRHSLKPGRGLLLQIPSVCPFPDPTFCALLSETTFGKRGKIQSPLLKPCSHMFQFFGSINGLVCISELEPVIPDHPIYNNTLYVWNPSLRKLKQIGKTRMVEQFTARCGVTANGFGYDSQSNVYKVVRIWYSQVLDYCCVFEADEVEVITLGCNEWKSFKPQKLNTIAGGDSAVHINGVIHWPASRSVKDDYNRILTFDVRNETFGEFPMPEKYIDGMELDEEKRPIFIGEFKGCLSVGVQCSMMESKNRDQLLIWIMKDYGVASSWTKLLNVVLPESVERNLGFTKRDEVLFQKENGNVSCYDTKVSKFYRVCKSHSFEVITLSETLVWFDDN